MADAKILSSVKNALGSTGTYQDGALNIYIDEVIAYMVGAGVPESVANSTASAGVIALGVTDLQYRGGKLSAYFYERLSQLNYEVDTEAEALKKEVAALQEQIATEQKEIETLQRELETAQSASNNLRAEVTELERQIAAKQAEIETLTQEKATLEQLVDELRAENETLKVQVETAEQQHNAEKAEMQKQHAEEVANLEQAHATEIAELEASAEENKQKAYNDGYNTGYQQCDEERDQYAHFATALNYKFRDLNKFNKSHVVITSDKVLECSQMFAGLVLNETVESMVVNIQSEITGCGEMFNAASGDFKLKHITFNVSTEKCTNFSFSFYALYALEVLDGIPLDLHGATIDYYLNYTFMGLRNLREIRILENSMKVSTTFASSSL